jgi:hypothetical protein
MDSQNAEQPVSIAELLSFVIEDETTGVCSRGTVNYRISLVAAGGDIFHALTGIRSSQALRYCIVEESAQHQESKSVQSQSIGI